MVETYFERRSKHTSSDGRKIPQERLKNISSMVATHLEPGRNEPRARSKHTSWMVENITRAWSKQTSRDVQNIPRATADHTSSTVETYLEHGQNIPRARSKHTSSKVETYLELRLNQTSCTFEAYFDHGRNIPWATVEINLMHGLNIPRTLSKHIPSTVETYRERRSKHDSCTVEIYFGHG